MSLDRPIRVGAVSFVNTLPLIRTLDASGEPAIELSLAPPAPLAEQMHAGAIDVGLIPVVEHFRAGIYRLISPVAICSRGPVETVSLFCRKPVREIETLLADARSRTSVALSQVWFAKAHGRRLRVVGSFDPENMVATAADAVLVIGDANWKFPRRGWVDIIDLGEAWTQLTGLGFVYAGWSARPELPAEVIPTLERRLTRAAAAGRAAIAELARRAAPGAGVSPQVIEHYLTDCIRLDIEEPERRGMELFRQWCLELGLV